jgi:hypothetical protein
MLRNENNTGYRRSRTLLALITFLMLFQAGAVLHVLQIPGELVTQISLPPTLELIANIAWAFFAAAVWVGLWTRRVGMEKKAVWLLVGFSVYSLLRLIVFVRADYDRGRLGFLTLMVILISVYAAVKTFLFSKKHPTEIIEK